MRLRPSKTCFFNVKENVKKYVCFFHWKKKMEIQEAIVLSSEAVWELLFRLSTDDEAKLT